MSSDRSRTFLFAFLGAAFAVAMLLGPFASSSPDGLEKVSEDEGFAEAAEDHGLAGSPLADYGVEGVDNERVGTALAGFVGVLVTLAIGAGIFAAVRRLGQSQATT